MLQLSRSLAPAPLARLAMPLAAALAVGCSPALETPPVVPGDGAATPGGGALDAGGGADADGGRPSLDGGANPSAADGGVGGSGAEGGGGACAQAQVASCTCPGLRDDGSAITGVQLCGANGVYEACRCDALDAGESVPSCGAAEYVGSLSGAVSFPAGDAKVAPTLSSLRLNVVGPVDAAGQRAVRGTLSASLNGLTPLTGTLEGKLSCLANPPSFSGGAVASFTWLGVAYALTGEFSGNLDAGSFDDGIWNLITDAGAAAEASGMGAWTASPK